MAGITLAAAGRRQKEVFAETRGLPAAIMQSLAPMLHRHLPLIIALLAAALSACTKESYQTLAPQSVDSFRTPYSGPKYKIAVGKFENRSPYMRGIFSDGTDRLGAQARQILVTHLSQSGRFSVLDRSNMDEITREAKLSGAQQKLLGGQIVVTGAVTEFGKKDVF